MDKHQHEPATTGPPRCYDGGVAGRFLPTNRRAHGDEQRTQTCACGAERRVLRNGPYEEIGPWTGGATPRAVDRAAIAEQFRLIRRYAAGLD